MFLVLVCFEARSVSNYLQLGSQPQADFRKKRVEVHPHGPGDGCSHLEASTDPLYAIPLMVEILHDFVSFMDICTITRIPIYVFGT